MSNLVKFKKINLKKYSSFDVYKPTYIIKKFTNNYFKIIYMKGLREKGFEPCFKKKKLIKKNLSLMNSFKTSILYSKLYGNYFVKLNRIAESYFNRFNSSISRAKSKIFEYSFCNDFDYFVTLTIDPIKFDRKNLNDYYIHFSQFIRDYRKKYSLNIQYLFVPEQHKDGSWHMHGLLKGIPLNHFIINDNGFLDWIPYKNKFGFISIDKIKNREACSIYMTKYITKDFYNNTKINKYNKLYYCSRGLKTSEVIFKGNLNLNLKPNFENEYIKIYDVKIGEC